MTATQSHEEMIRNRISNVSMLEDRILDIDIDAHESFTRDDMQELIDSARELGGGRRFLNLINVGADTTPDHEAREYSASWSGSRYKIADAFILNSHAQKIVANFYMKFHRPPVPTRCFCSKEKALAWLRSVEWN